MIGGWASYPDCETVTIVLQRAEAPDYRMCLPHVRMRWAVLLRNVLPLVSHAVGVECYCCGEERDESMVTSLLCHDEIKVCRICVGWLNKRAGGIEVTPTLPVADMGDAVRFCEAAGFDVEQYDNGFAFVHLNDQSVFDLNVVADMDPATNYAGCYIITDDVDDWHGRLAATGLQVTSIEDMPWGMNEFTLTDPSGNNIRIGRNLSDD